ncbi:MAG TPA: YcxB family protein [Verrucomicrobiae bacterium]|nr:YcxB family protein [Verrucomicrobiae bacterium]
MSIKTETTQEDYRAFVKHVAREVSAASSDKMVQMFFTITVTLGVMFALSFVLLSSHLVILPALACGALASGFILMVFITDFSRKQIKRMRPSDDGIVVGSHEFSLEDEGIRIRSRHHHSVIQWSVVRAITVTDQHIFIMIDRVAGLILPKRAFSSDPGREQFVSEIERRSGKVRT